MSNFARSQVEPIRPLPADVACQINSSITFTSVNAVILELVKNSLDARPAQIHISVDYAKGSCSVEDNGVGIPPDEFESDGGLGKMQHTSKLNCATDFYGYRGCSLASIAALSVLTISSRHQAFETTSAISFYNSRPISRLVPVPLDHTHSLSQHGTIVSAGNIFGNMPVRIKQRAHLVALGTRFDGEWDDLKKRLTALLLAYHHTIRVTIERQPHQLKQSIAGRYESSSRTNASLRFDPRRIYSLLSGAGYSDDTSFEDWSPASASTPQVSVKAMISLQPAASKQTQFVSFGQHPIFADSHANILYDEINQLFLNSQFGSIETGFSEECSEREARRKEAGRLKRHLKRVGKGVDRWPMFFVRIDCNKDFSNAELARTHDRHSEKSLQRIIEILSAMVFQWLQEHGFRPQHQRHKREVSRAYANSDRSHSRCGTVTSSQSVLAGIALSHRTISSAPGTALSSLSNSKRLQTSFGSWSRVKGSNSKALQELTSGLPESKKSGASAGQLRHERQAVSMPPALVDAEGTPPNVMPTDAPDGRVLDDAGVETSSSTTLAIDPIMFWTEPGSNRRIPINSRTGGFVPESASHKASIQRSFSRSSLPQRPHTAPSLLRNTHPLPRPRSSCSDTALISSTTDSWLGGVLDKWENPVFSTGQPMISVARNTVQSSNVIGSTESSCGSTSEFHASGSKLTKKLSRWGLENAEVIAQVDQKFIFAKIPIRNSEARESDEHQGHVLVLIDQHAADERCRVEQLLAEFFKNDARSDEIYGGSLVWDTEVPVPIRFNISRQESSLFQKHKDFFLRWGIAYEAEQEPIDSVKDMGAAAKTNATSSSLKITRLPVLIASRCIADPKLLLTILRTELWSSSNSKKQISPSTSTAEQDDRYPWLQHLSSIPQSILNLINSRACRTAIMFNDALDVGECENLVRRLSLCAFPWSCAHGRPSIVTLVSLQSDVYSRGSPECRLQSISSEAVLGLALGGVGASPETDDSTTDFLSACKVWTRGTER